MTKTYSAQELHNLAARLRATHCEPGTDPDAFEASDVINRLHHTLAEVRDMLDRFDTPADTGRVKAFVGDLRQIVAKVGLR